MKVVIFILGLFLFNNSYSYAAQEVISKEIVKKERTKKEKQSNSNKTLFLSLSIVLCLGAASIFIVGIVLSSPFWVWLVGLAFLLLGIAFLLFALLEKKDSSK